MERGICARENICSILKTLTTINKHDTPETFTGSLNTLTASHYNYYTVCINNAAGYSSQNAQTPVMLFQNLTQTYFK